MYYIQDGKKGGSIDVKGITCFCRDKDNCNVARINEISTFCIVFAFGLKML